jgi:glycosyltransferase involved in cell wall biosynthesis
MKVVFDDIIFELQRAGGISKYWSKLIEYFSKNRAIELRNIQSGHSKQNVFYPHNLELNIVEESFLPVKIRRYMNVEIPRDCEIFHSSYYRLPKSKNNTLKQIVTVHDFMYEYFDSGLKKYIHVWQKKRSMENADAIICVSEHTKKDLLSLYPEIDPNILHVVPNGVDEEFKILKEKPTQLTIGNINLEDQNFLLYVGNRVGCKNFAFVLELYKKSAFLNKNKFKIVCVGGGEFSLTELEHFKSLKCDVDDFVNFQRLSNEDLNKLYNLAYALIFPSQYEGFGIPALEAQAAGCPVVYARTSSLPEVVAYDELGYEFDNLNEVDHKLEMLQDHDFRQEIIKKGVKHASKLTWENTANLTYEVYKHILESN